MPDPMDFLPQPPWEGPPIPRYLTYRARGEWERHMVGSSHIIKLRPSEYSNPRWGEIAAKAYASNLGWTKKVTGDIAWYNPRNSKQFIRFISSTADPRTVTVYNSKVNLREVLNIV